MFWISITLQLIIFLLGTFLEEAYKDPLYAYWLIVIAFLTIFSQTLIANNAKLKGELDNYKTKVSALSTKKDSANHTVQIAVLPETKILIGQEVKIELFLTSTLPLKNKPSIKLITDSEWEIKISNQLQTSSFYGGKYEYVLFNPTNEIIEDKFMNTKFYVKFSKPGNHSLMIEHSDGSAKGSLETSLTVYKN